MPQLIRRLDPIPRGAGHRASAGRAPLVNADARFRHPGYEGLRAVVRDVVVVAGVFAEGEALVLVAHGLEATAERLGISARTIRRRFAATGTSVREVLLRTRVEVTLRASRDCVPTTIVARWLGFASADVYRRFVRRELGASIKELRLAVRESAEYPAADD